MSTEIATGTIRATQVELTYLENRTILSALLTSKSEDKINLFAKEEIIGLGTRDTNFLYRRLIAGLSRDDTNWDQDKRSGALVLLSFMDFQKLEPGQIAIPYINAVQCQDRESDPYGSVDALLQAGSVIIPHLLKDPELYIYDIFNQLQLMVWRIPAEQRGYAEEELRNLIVLLPQFPDSLPKEIPLVMKTGAEIRTPGQGYRFRGLHLKNLLDLKPIGEARIPLTFDHVQQTLQMITGAMLPEQVYKVMGFDNLKRWEAIWDASAPSLLFIGNNDIDISPMLVDNAIGTIFIHRSLSPQIDKIDSDFKRVDLYSVRCAGILPDNPRVIEFSYENPSCWDLRQSLLPSGLKLAHIGFSISQAEFPEDPRKLLQNIGNYYNFQTRPSPTKVNDIFDDELYSIVINGSVVTNSMHEITGHGRQLIIDMDHFSPGQKYRLYPGNEKLDSAKRKEFLLVRDGDSVAFGNIPDRRGRQKSLWKVILPVNIP